jgi:beta-glucanase (GH16 family)
VGPGRWSGRGLAIAAAIAAAACGLAPPEEPPPPDTHPSPPTSTPTPTPTPDPGAAPAVPPAGWRLVWSDEFDGSGLDPTRWIASEGERRDAYNTPDAITVGDGLLTVTTSTEDGRHETGFLGTQYLFRAKFGYFEARIRFEDAPGSWCAFWLHADTNGQPVGDPANAGVEIDVVEHRFTDQGGWTELPDLVALTLNWDGYGKDKKTKQQVVPLADGAPVQGAWHTYGVTWSPSGYTFYVDASPLWTVAGPVSEIPESLQLTCEVQDASWAGDVPPGGYGPRALSTTRMQVDWVRVWQAPP